MNDLQTAAQIALAKIKPPKNYIPRITHEWGRHWQQPDRSEIVLDDTHAVMNRDSFDRLADYSCTNPSGVYEGKMWKRRKDYYDESKGWLLVWYGLGEREGYCSNNARTILIIEI